jgi:threonine dehydrogenase-like Zn-dependent dehydrogenase
MRAVTWQGVNDLRVEDVADPTIVDDQDAILRVRASATCGSDLHLIDGYIPSMREGDVLGHEFLGEVVETGRGVERLSAGDRVVVCSIIACGRCWFCQQGLLSACDNTNPNPALPEAIWGHAPAGIFGYSHMTGGFAGSHADYVRVPFADQGCFIVPEGLDDDAAVYASDAVPTGWMGADNAAIVDGDVVAVWGAGGVGQMAAKAALLMGAGRVVVIDRFPERLDMVTRHIGAEALDYTDVDVHDALLEMTAGRGPDRCIEAVGMEAHGEGLEHAYDRVKQAVRLQTERGTTLRQAIRACRKGGTVSVLGVFGGFLDKVPMGAAMNKGLTLRLGQQHGHKYIPMLLERMTAGDIPTAHLTTHPLPLDAAPDGYRMFKDKADGCVRAVFHPTG